MSVAQTTVRVGIATQQPHLRELLIVDEAAARLDRFFGASVALTTTLGRACGHDHLARFSPDDLMPFNRKMAHPSAVNYGGVTLENGRRAARGCARIEPPDVPSSDRLRRISSVDATAYLAPYPRRSVRRPLLIRQTAATYPLEPVAEDSWLAIAFRAFARLAERRRVRDVLILGTGNGLDALAALEIFDPDTLSVTDLFEECLSVARENVLAHLEDGAAAEIDFFAGDLLTAVPATTRVDLVYENLPNIPTTPDVELGLGINTGRFFDATGLDVPVLFDTRLLALHWRCLRDAWTHVRPGGGVLTALGGRVPQEVAFELHRDCGYRPELVAFDVKLQAEPALVLPGYGVVEEEKGIEFTFYSAEAVEIVADARATGLDGEDLRAAVASDLERLAMSAREAERRAQRGESVAHSVLMIFGQRPD